MTVTGSVFPIGDGGVGKTALSKAMSEYKGTSSKVECIDGLKKTVNMEFEFVNCKCTTSDEAILLQMYVPPGQRSVDQAEELGTFEKVMETYSFMPNMQNISVILLVYKLSEFRTLAVLETWLETALMEGLIKPFTNAVLVGTHLDITPFDVKPEQVQQAVDFVRSKIEENIADYRGCIEQTYVSNVTGTGIPELRNELAELVCMAQHLRHGTQPDCEDACTLCMDRRCKELVPTV
ncbi:MAG: GTPase domain-containing protein [Promethearchaeota archaeon]